MVVAGESAGGNLALALMQRSGTPDSAPPMRLRCCRHGATSHSAATVTNEPRPTLVLDNDELRVMANLYRGDAAVDDPLVSPVHADFTGLPPTFITTGTRDLLLSDGSTPAGMRSDGVDVTLRIWEACGTSSSSTANSSRPVRRWPRSASGSIPTALSRPARPLSGCR